MAGGPALVRCRCWAIAFVTKASKLAYHEGANGLLPAVRDAMFELFAPVHNVQ